jgi:hypothetical protein
MNVKHIESPSALTGTRQKVRTDSKTPLQDLNGAEQDAPQANDVASTVSDKTQREKISFWEAACYWALARR